MRAGKGFRAFAAVLFIFAGTASGIFSETYWWKGTTDNNWNEPSNWVYKDEYDVEQTALQAPGTDDTALFDTGSAVTIGDNVTAGVVTSASGLSFEGNCTVSTLTVSSGNVSCGRNLTVDTAASIVAGNLSVTGNAVINGDLVVSAGSFTVSSDLSYSGTVYASGDIYATGSTTASANASIQSDAKITFNTSYVGSNPSAITAGGLLKIGSGGAQFRGNISAGSIEVDSDSSILAGTNTITTTGTQEWAGEVLVNNNVTLTGSTVTFDGDVQSHSSGAVPRNITVTGNAVFAGNTGSTIKIRNLSVSENASFSGTLSTSQAVSVGGDASFGGAVTASGELSVGGDAVIGAAVSASSVTVTGKTTFNASPVTTTAKQTYTDDVTLGTALVLNSSQTADGTVTFGSGVTGASNNLTVNAPAVFAGAVSGCGNISVDGDAVFAGNVSSCGDFSVTGDAEFNGTLGGCGTVSVTGDAQFDKAVSDCTSLLITGGAVFAQTVTDTDSIYITGTCVFGGNVSGVQTLTCSDETTVLGNISTSGTQIYNGTVTVTSSGKTFTCDPSSEMYFNAGFAEDSYLNLNGNAEISGSNVFASFTVDNSSISSATTVSFGNGTWQSFGAVSCKGNSTVNTLTLGSPGLWYAVFPSAPSESDFEYVIIENSYSVEAVSSPGLNELGLIPSAATIKDSDPSSPTTAGWFTKTFYWLGGTSSDWTDTSNWAYDASGSDMALSYPLYGGQGNTIFVHAGSSTSSAPYILTVTEDEIDVSSITVESSVTLDLASADVTASDFVNNGTVRMDGSQDITADMTNGSGSLIEYYGSSVSFPWDGGSANGRQYEKLLLTGSASSLDIIEISSTFDINTTGNVTLSGNCIFDGNVTVTQSGNLTLSGANDWNGTLTLTAASAVILNGNSDGINFVPGTVTCTSFENRCALASSGNLTVDSASAAFKGDLTIGGTLEVTGTALIAADISTDGTQTYDGTVTLGADSTLTSSSASAAAVHFMGTGTGAGYSLTVNAPFTADGELSGFKDITVNDAAAFNGAVSCTGSLTAGSNAEFNGNVSALSVSVIGTSDINCSSVTASSQTYTGAVVLGGTGAHVFTGTSNTASLVWFKDSFTGNSDNVSALLSKIRFDGTVSDCVNIDVTGNAVFGAAVTLSGALTAASDASFAGAFSADSVSVGGAASVTAASVTTSQNQTYTDAFSFDGDLTLSAASGAGTITFGSSVTGYGDLVLAGTVSVTGSAHTFTLKDSNSSPSSYKTVYFDYGFASNASVSFASNAEVKGDNSFSILAASSPQFPLTLKFEAGKTQTVSTSLYISGTASNSITLNSLTEGSVFYIRLSTVYVAYDVNHAVLKDCYNSTVSAGNPYFLSALESADEGNNWYWNFPGENYSWLGSASGNENDWFTKENWTPSSVPSAGAIVTIPAGRTDYPVLDLANAPGGVTLVSVGNTAGFEGTITVESGALIDLAQVSVTASAFTNYGTVRLYGTQSVNASMANGTDSTVEYYGGTAASPLTSFVWDGNSSAAGAVHENLLITGDIETSQTVKVSGSTVIDVSDSSYSVKLTSLSNVLAGSSETVTITSAYDAELYSSSAFTLASGAVSESLLIKNSAAVTLNGAVTTNSAQVYKCPLVLASSLTLEASSIDFSQGENQSVSGSGKTLTLSTGSVSFENNLVIYPAVLFTQNLEITGSASRTITFDSAVDSSPSALSLTVKNASSKAVFNGFVGNTTALSSLEVEGQTQINTSSVITAGAQTYRGNVYISADAVLTGGAGEAVSFGRTLTGNTTDLTIASSDAVFSGNVSSFVNLDVEGSTTFQGSSAQSVTTTGNQTYEGSAVVNSALSLTADDGISSTDETITFNSITSGTGSLSVVSSIAVLNAGDYITDGKQSFECSKGVRLLQGSTGGTWQASASSGEYDIFINDSPLFLDFESDSLTVNADLAAGDIYFYSGDLTVTSGKTVRALKGIGGKGCIVMWGSSYSAEDPRYASGNTRFAWYGKESLVYQKTSFSASLSAFGAVLYAEGNFWANGLDLSGFTLKVPDNSSSNPVFNPTSAVTQKQWGLPYAAAFNSTVTGVTASLISGSGSAWLCAGEGQTQNCTDGGGNTNVQFTVPYIDQAYTVYDDVIYVHFNMPLENSNGEISQNAALYSSGALASGGLWYSDTTADAAYYFTGVYSDADCTETVSASSDIQEFYIRAQETWNTDATGSSPYGSASKAPVDSTDRSGNKKLLKADLNFIEGLFTAAQGHTMCRNYGINLENGSAAASYTDTEDHTAPVLIHVYTGQELHSEGTASVQNTYDAHNFIEFRYSEAVDTGSLLSDGASVNQRAQSSFDSAAEYGGEISSSGSGLEVKGYAKIASGSITASVKSGSGSPHALYRSFAASAGDSPSEQTHRIRVSAAGYVDGTVTFTDSKNAGQSGTYHNWTGYISGAVTPSGSIERTANPYITDKAEDGSGNSLLNILDAAGTVNHPLPDLSVETGCDEDSDSVPDSDVLYGMWDVLPPMLAPFISEQTGWNEWASGADAEYQEIIGSADSTSDSYLEHIELHFMDNNRTQAGNWPAWWRTKLGWNNSPLSGDPSLPDIKGGARPFATDSSITSGGIRLSSLAGENSHFTYKSTVNGVTSAEKNIDGSTDIARKVYNSIFRASSDPDSQADGLYVRLPLAENTLPVRTTFEVYYDPAGSYITDLAGNLLSSTYTTKTAFSSIDLTPPAFTMTLSPVGENKIYAVFTKELAAKFSDGRIEYIRNLDSASLASVLEEIKDSFVIIPSGSGSGVTSSSIEITEVEYVSSTVEYTAFMFTLERDITLTDIEGLWIRDIGHGSDTVVDACGFEVSDTKIFDYIGNYLTQYSGHAVSDFAVNAVEVLYAKGEAQGDDGWDEQGIYGTGVAVNSSDYAVHDFTRSQGNYGKLSSGRDITLQVKLNSGDESTPPSENFVLIPSKKSVLTSDMVSDKINTLLGTDWRLWLPSSLNSLATAPNTNTLTAPADPVTADEGAGFLWNYSFPDADYGFKAGEEIQFVFKVQNGGSDITIDHDADSWNAASPTDNVPLYAVWMPRSVIESGNFSFIDLWSFGIKDVKQQRGGVTVLNNVINVNTREKTVIEVKQQEEGTLNVYVMTLDGNIVWKTQAKNSAGTYYYYWNGTNRAGNPVARGLYFVRVTGPGIDETRKVLCVKD